MGHRSAIEIEDMDRFEDEHCAHPMDRQALIAKVSAMISAGGPAEAIVDEVVASLTPEDGDECPVCGICP
jgi:hypothetical protein